MRRLDEMTFTLAIKPHSARMSWEVIVKGLERYREEEKIRELMRGISITLQHIYCLKWIGN